MKRTLAIIGLALLAAGVSRADFDPVLLTPGSFTADVVVENTAPPALIAYTTASMDDGTNNNNQTWFEAGYDATRPTTGLPLAGSTFTAVGDGNRTFQMPASYTTANALLLTTSGLPTGTITLPPSTTAVTLSFLCSASGGTTTLDYTVNFQGGGSESGQVTVFDWFNNTEPTVAWITRGRVNVGNAQLTQITGNPKLFYADIPLGNTTTPVESVTFTTTSGSRAAIFGLSVSTDYVNFAPVAIGGFNRDVVVEATAVFSGSLLTKCNVIMDSGATNLTGNTWYEMGFNTGATNTGLPKAGTSITNTILGATRSFTMPPSYEVNNVIYIGNYDGYMTGTLTLSSPASLAALSFLNAAGNGPVTIQVTVHHEDTGSETFNFDSPNWFNQANPFYTAAGRFHTLNLGLNDVNSSNPRLHVNDVTLANSSPVTSIDFAYVSGGRAMIFAVAGQASAGAEFLPLAVTGFTADGVVEASAARFPNPLYTSTSASMDGGTNNVANTWYERGYNSNRPDTGLPPAGSEITSINLPDHRYQMAASYSQNNAVYVDSSITSANLTIANPATYSALSFLSACANGRVTNYVIMQYADGTQETNLFNSLDWFSGTPYAFTSRGRFDVDNRTFNNVGSDNPRLYEAQFALGNTGSPVTNLVLGYLGSQNTSGRMFVFAVSATAGAVPPIITTVIPQNSLVMEGTNLTISATITGGTEPISFQWQKQDGENWIDVADGGPISGATTKDLVLTGLTLANAGTYRLHASNVAGAADSGPAVINVLSGLPDITQPGDPVILLAGSTPGAESASQAIGNTVQKYLNFDADSANPFVGPVGIIVQPTIGSTIVSGLRFYTANDADGRDPADYTLEGSNDGGQTWSLISTNPLALPTGRNNQAGTTPINPLTMNIREVLFANSADYVSYRITFHNVRDNAGNNSMQIGEIEFLGTVALTAPYITRHPQAASTIYAGASPWFMVEAAGTPPLSYQWYRGASLITGATDAAYVLQNAQASDSGSSFSCRVSNPYGYTDSSAGTITVIAAPTQAYPVAVLGDQPMAYWRLNETDNGSGNTGVEARDYIGGHSGSYNNVVLSVAGYNSVVDADTGGQFGYIAYTDSYVGDIPGIDFGTPAETPVAFSVEAWVNGNGNFQTSDAGLVTKGRSGAEQFNMDTGSGGSSLHGLRFFVRTASGAVVGAGSTNSMDQDSAWHHVVGVCDLANEAVTLYVDGQAVASTHIAADSGILSSMSPVSIGSRQNGSGAFVNQFFGFIDDVAIYKYALSAEQVLSHYYGGQFPPLVQVDPVDTYANENSTAMMQVTAYGAPAVTYQWYDVTSGDPGVLVDGQTSDTLVINNVPAAYNGRSYRVTVSNPYGSVVAPNLFQPAAVLYVISGPPTITADLPARSYGYIGRTVTMSVQVSGTEPFTYVWRSNGVTVVDGGRVSGAQTGTLTIQNAQPGDSASYDVLVSNVHGGPAASTATALTVNGIPTFNTDGAGWTLNGDAAIADNVLTLTTTTGQRSSVFLNYPLYVGGFRATFTYQDIGGGGADGFALVAQNDERGVTALGGGGGGLAYLGIQPSAALLFNIYGTAGISVQANGATGGYQPTSPVNIANGNPIDVLVEYTGDVMRLTLTDAITSATFSADLPVGSLPAIVGAETAFVGVTGASGGIASNQQVKNFSLVPLPSVAAQMSGANALTLSWPASVGGFSLIQSSDLSAWQPVASAVTQVGDRFQVTVSPLTGARFYRLVLP